MKIAPKAASGFLQQPDRGCAGVLLYGPDAGLVHERMLAIAGRVAGSDAFARKELAGEQVKKDPALLSDELSALSLLGGRCAVILRDARDAHSAAIASAVSDTGNAHYLIVCAEELAPRSSLRQLFEQTSHLAALPCYKDEAADIQALLRERLAQARITCPREVMAWLAQHLGNDRGVTAREIEKIVLYAGEGGELTQTAAEALVAYSRDVTSEAVCMAMASQDVSALEGTLSQALRDGMQPVALLRTAQRHIQRLLAVKEALRAGKTLEAAMNALRPPVFFRHAPVFGRQAQHWREEALLGALRALGAAELSCKQTGVSPALLCREAIVGVALTGKSLAA